MFDVHLVFHGVFAFVLNEGEIDVLLPYFSPHQYLFGCWGDLEPLGKGELKLIGLRGGEQCWPDPDFSSDQSPTVTGFTEQCPDNLFCTLKLDQYPKSVHSFRPYNKPLNFGGSPIPRFPFYGVHGKNLNPSALAGPVVLSYHADRPNDIEIVYRGKPLKFNRIPEKEVPTLNLHFFAEGESDLPPDGDRDRLPQVSIHYEAAWTRLTSIIAGMDVRLQHLWPFVMGHTQPLPPETGLPGLPPCQLADLDEIRNASLHPDRDPYGGDTDCDKAHIVIDNRPKR